MYLKKRFLLLWRTISCWTIHLLPLLFLQCTCIALLLLTNLFSYYTLSGGCSRKLVLLLCSATLCYIINAMLIFNYFCIVLINMTLQKFVFPNSFIPYDFPTSAMTGLHISERPEQGLLSCFVEQLLTRYEAQSLQCKHMLTCSVINFHNIQQTKQHCFT